VNFWATVYVNKTFLPLLEARTEAALLNVSSMGGLVPVPGQGAYGASKAAVKLLTETLQAELRGSNVAVTVVFPGGVGTHITENSGVELPKLQPGATARVTPPETAGRLIVDAVEQGKPRLLIGNDAKSLDRLSRLMPTRAIFIVADRMKKLLA
jgi:short-subunit dehydrogenase